MRGKALLGIRKKRRYMWRLDKTIGTSWRWYGSRCALAGALDLMARCHGVQICVSAYTCCAYMRVDRLRCMQVRYTRHSAIGCAWIYVLRTAHALAIAMRFIAVRCGAAHGSCALIVRGGSHLRYLCAYCVCCAYRYAHRLARIRIQRLTNRQRGTERIGCASDSPSATTALHTIQRNGPCAYVSLSATVPRLRLRSWCRHYTVSRA